MKTMTTLTAIAVLIAGVSIAAAQNAGGPAPSGASPSNINKGSLDNTNKGAQSGNESGSTAMKPAKSTTGAGMQSPSKEVTKSPASTDAGMKNTKDK
jgi:hypothetical protein